MSRAAVSHADHAVGRIISTLEEEGLDKDTLVILFSDNGGEPPGVKGYLKPVPTYRTTTATDKYGDNKTGIIMSPGCGVPRMAPLDNLPDTLDAQLESLEKVGFKDVDCYFKYGIFSVFGGFK